jgi:hypothetical protein
MMLYEMQPLHKGIYFVLVVFLLLVEYRAIQNDARQRKADFEASMTQVMGGDGFPYLMPVIPAIQLNGQIIYPVRVFYENKENIPLVDVNVDVRLVPKKDERAEKYIITGPLIKGGSEEDSIFHPRHYYLGNILPGASDTPIQLVPGKHYYLVITTRRGFFNEKVDFDADENQPNGWRVNQCLYRVSNNELLRGKCD